MCVGGGGGGLGLMEKVKSNSEHMVMATPLFSLEHIGGLVGRQGLGELLLYGCSSYELLPIKKCGVYWEEGGEEGGVEEIPKNPDISILLMTSIATLAIIVAPVSIMVPSRPLQTQSVEYRCHVSNMI